MKKKNGQVMIISIILIVVVVILSASLFSKVAAFLHFSSNSVYKEQAYHLAEAGVDFGIWQLNQSASFTGQNNVSVGTTGTFSVSVTSKSSSLKTITSTGYVPSSFLPRAKRTIKTDVLIDNTIIAFNYALQIGTGGLSMSNSSIIHGTVYSNGNITGSGPSTIDGDAYAVGTISTPPSVNGDLFPNSAPSQMPTIDYASWEAAANVNNDPIVCSPTCDITNDANIGPRKYIGNLHIGNNAKITMKGPVYVTGNFNMTQGNTKISLDSSFGSTGTVLIADGIIDMTQGGQFAPTNATPKGYILVVSTSSANNALGINQSGASAIFYALNGGAQLAQSAKVNALIAKSISMANSASLTYDSGLASAAFSSGPGGAWTIKKGTYKQTTSP